MVSRLVKKISGSGSFKERLLLNNSAVIEGAFFRFRCLELTSALLILNPVWVLVMVFVLVLLFDCLEFDPLSSSSVRFEMFEILGLRLKIFWAVLTDPTFFLNSFFSSLISLRRASPLMNFVILGMTVGLKGSSLSLLRTRL